MNRQPSLWVRSGSALTAVGIRAWMRTLSYRAHFADPAVDASLPADRPRIYVFWHEYILLPLYLRGHCNLSMLLSKHRDADILDCVARRMGFDCVRGSTYNGASLCCSTRNRNSENRKIKIEKSKIKHQK
ncbi:DUF374 domain-containing protein [Pirellulales bacterium]|nr:DUF374 domain-containing protein [Pirellulales bacterium]